ncbi:MAG TPA: PAS domain-containing protein, partial [Isosphaeraceae bacterium]|nr:PAS domain-containing protein [Isosphaeraceae bacterium]
GRSVQEVLGAVGTPFEPLLRQVIETRQPLVNWEYEARAPNQPESLRHWSATYYPALSESGEVLGVGALVADITERRVASERLAESLAQVEALIEGAPFAITLLDRDLRYVQINETMASIHGKPVSEYLGRTFREVLPEAAGQFEAELREVVETGRPKLNRFFEGRVPAQPGKRGRWVGNWFPVRTVDGQVLGVGVIAMEITEQMRVEEALRQSERRYRTLTDAVVQLMWANDADGNTLFVNRRWEDFSGLTPDDVLKSGWLRLVYPDDLTRILDLRSRAIAEGKPYEIEYRLRARDGSYRWHIIRTVPIRDAAGHLEGWFGTATDIHDLKSAETSLQTARDAAEAASQAKSQFLAVLSHELRNPLAPALIAVASLLDNPQTPDALRPSLEVARRNIELETRLIDDLLDVTRIAQGKLLMDRVPVDAHELIQRAVEICRDDINLKNLAIHVNLDAVNPRIEADPARFQQIIWNLLKNAAKYTPAQGSIRVRTWNPEEEPSVLAVEVQDTGRGIEASALPRIFDAFEQADPRVTRQFGGLGLGLAISRSLAEALEGTLQARSPGLNQGSTFTLRLPTTIRPSSEPDASDDANDAGAGPLAILLVEDNPDSLNLL